MSFGEALKKELERAGMTAYRLAQLTGTSQASLSRVLSGDGSPSWDTVQKICKALGVSCMTFQSEIVELPEATEERGRGRPKSESDQIDQAEADGSTEPAPKPAIPKATKPTPKKPKK